MARLHPNDPQLAAPDFPHGEYRGYRRGCSCVPCRTANAVKLAARRARQTGRPGGPALGARVSGAMCCEHLAMLFEAGTPAEVARATGLNPSVILKLRGDPARTVTQTSVDAILAVDVRAVRRNRILLPAGRVRRHVQTLLELPGVDPRAVAQAAGLSLETIRNVLHGTRKQVWAETAIALLAVQPTDLHPRLVSPRLATQRLRSLQANGHPITSLRRAVGGLSLSFLREPPQVILSSTDRAVADLYDRLGDTPGPSAHAARFARNAGWYPPIFYDDDGNLIAEAVRREDSTEAWHEQIERRHRDRLRILGMLLRGVYAVELAARIDVSTKQVERVRKFVGLDVTFDQLDRAVKVHDGQEQLVAKIRAAIDGIDLDYPTECCDLPGIDYQARFAAITAVDATETGAAA